MEQYMRRCFDLALRGAGRVSPNPLVGAVLVCQDRIIGEGWHEQYGQAHAEVNAVRAVQPADRHLIPESTLYCSLEPCFHYGKTPPCVDLILQERIPRVVVSCTDPNPLVAGKSVEKLRAAGVQVESGVLKAEGLWLNRVFFTWITRQRPYIVLKWAQSRDGYLGRAGERTAVSGPAAQRLLHRWRSELDAILVGAETARIDNPRLDTRLFGGRPPLRIAFDRDGALPLSHHVLDDRIDTWIVGKNRPGAWQRTQFISTGKNEFPIPELLARLKEANKSSLLVEGGGRILESWLAGGYWDELRVIENARYLHGGIAAPRLPAEAWVVEEFQLGDDRVSSLRSE